MSFDIRVNDKAVMDALDQLDRKMARSKVQKALAAGAKFLKPKVKAETPTGPGHFGYHLKNRVSAGAAKRDKPAAIVKYRSRREHWLLLGTRHSRANPIITRVADQYEDEALDIVDRELARLLELD